MRVFCTLVVLFISLLNTLDAQVIENKMLFKRAKAYQRAGKLEEAAEILERLARNNPDNIPYSNSLKDIYSGLNRYDKILEILNMALERHPANWRIEAEMVDAYLKSGEVEKGMSIVRKLTDTYPENYSLRRTVALVLQSNRFFDETVDIYVDAQNNMEDPAPVTRDLANFYAARLNYIKATEEYVKFLSFDSKNYNYVRKQLSRFSSDSATVRLVLSRLEKGLAESPDSANLRQLVADYHYRSGNLRESFEGYVVLEQNSESDGWILFDFIQTLKREKHYKIGIEAAYRFMTLKPESRLYPQVYFLLAELTELSETARYYPDSDYLLAHPKRFGEGINEAPAIPQSIALYDSIASTYTNSSISGRAYFRMGEINLNRLQNLDEAERAFESSLNASRKPEIVEPALMRLADVSLERGMLETAKGSYLELAERARSEELRLHATFSACRIEYFSGELDSALYHLNELIFEIDFEDKLMNDVLELSILIQIAKSHTTASAMEELKMYAKADLLSYRRKHSEARSAFLSLTDEHPDSPFSDDALFMAGELSAKMGRYRESKETFDRFLEIFPESDLNDKALVAAAEVSEVGLEDRAAAVYYYEKLLIEHPRSLYSERARKKLRKIADSNKVN